MEGSFYSQTVLNHLMAQIHLQKLEAQERWKETPKLNITDQIARINLA